MNRTRVSSRYAVLACMAFAASSAAEVRLVPTQYPTIQAAIDSAVDGDEVVLAAGTYTGEGCRDLDFGGKAITVRGTDPRDAAVVAATILDCQGSEADPHRAFVFQTGEGSGSRVEGLTITNGYAPLQQIGSWNWRTGGAVLCVGSSPTIAHCVMHGNHARRGGAIASWSGSAPAITDCVFAGNSAEIDGGAIFGRDSSPTVSNCTLLGNTGTAVFCSGSGSATIWNCTIRENAGSAIYSDQAESLIANCLMLGNETGTKGAVQLSSSSGTIRNCLINGNLGGGVRVFGGEPAIHNCTITSNQIPTMVEGPLWIDTPDQLTRLPGGHVRGYWQDKLWGFRSSHLISYDGALYEDGAYVTSGNAVRKLHYTDDGVFAFSYCDGVGYLEKSVDGRQDFAIKLSGINSIHSLAHSLVSCGPTDEHPNGVMFYLEYPGSSPRFFASVDGGESWVVLFQCAFESIRHFHGAVFAPSVGANEGRLYVMTGDSDPESSILICDDIDDLIAAPQIWSNRWGLDLPNERHIDPDYTINDNLDVNGAPTSQSFRSIEFLLASDGYGYWAVDSALEGGQPVFRVNQSTRAVERIGAGTAIGAGWLWLETADGVLLFMTEVGTQGDQPKPGHDYHLHLYALTPDRQDFTELKRWLRTDSATPEGPVVANYFVEAFDHVWIGVTAGHVEYGVRNLAGRIERDPEPRGVGVHAFDSQLTMQDCILWGNCYEDVSSDDSPQIAGETTLASYSCVQGLAVSLDDAGNINTDPQFVDSWGTDGVAGTEDDDLHLLPDSPCINAGDPTVGAVPGEGDLDSLWRVLCGRVDMGAFEFGGGDYDCDRTVNLGDFIYWPVCMTGPESDPYDVGCEAFDFNADARVDLRDFAGFQVMVNQASGGSTGKKLP